MVLEREGRITWLLLHGPLQILITCSFTTRLNRLLSYIDDDDDNNDSNNASFMVAPSTAALLHRKPASASTLE